MEKNAPRERTGSSEISGAGHTANIIEGLNRQFRQITKNKPGFTNDDSLRRMLYLASRRIAKHWYAWCQNWEMVLAQLQIVFADRAVGCPLALACSNGHAGIHAASGAHTAPSI